jgi:hypothetical protein
MKVTLSTNKQTVHLSVQGVYMIGGGGSGGGGIPDNHAFRHASGGADPITPAAIGASPSSHSHTASQVGADSFGSAAAARAAHEAAFDHSLIGQGGGSGVSVHSQLSGLANDDHPQYLNNARGDARYALTGSLQTLIAPPIPNQATVTKYVNAGAQVEILYVSETEPSQADKNAVAALGVSRFYWENTTGVVITIPSTPTGLTVTAPSQTQLDVSWNGVAGATTYTLQVANTQGGTYTNVAGQPQSGTTFNLTGLSAGTTRWFRVLATNSAGSSAYSTAVSGTTQAAQPAPATPTGLNVVAVGQTQLNVSWNASSGATSYTLQESTTQGGTYSNVPGQPQTGTTFSRTGLTANTTRWYRVLATNANGSSAYSTAVSGTTEAQGSNQAPTAPTNLSAGTYLEDGTGFTLSWAAASDPDGSVASYRIYRAGVRQTALEPITGTSRVIGGQTAGSTANWTVSAVDNEGLEGSQSSALAVLMIAAPPSITMTGGDGKVTLGRGTATGAASYNARYTTNGTTPTKTTGTLLTGIGAETDITVANGTTVKAVVWSVNNSGAGLASSVAEATAEAAGGGTVYTENFDDLTIGYKSNLSRMGGAFTFTGTVVSSQFKSPSRATSNDALGDLCRFVFPSLASGTLRFWARADSPGVYLSVSGAANGAYLAGNQTFIEVTIPYTGGSNVTFNFDSGDEGTAVYFDDFSWTPN